MHLECFSSELYGAVDVVFGMSGADKCGFELRWGEIDALVEHVMEECVEAGDVARLCGCEIHYIFSCEEDGEHRSHAIYSGRDVRFAEDPLKPELQAAAEFVELHMHTFGFQPLQC